MSKSLISDFLQDPFRHAGNDDRQKDACIDETLDRWRREAAELSGIGTKPFDIEAFRSLNGKSMRCYFRMPIAWQTHPQAWRCYVEWAIGRQLAENEAPHGAILEFMLLMGIGFNGNQHLLLEYFGDQFFLEHRALFIDLLYQELKKRSLSAQRIADIGKLLIRESQKTSAEHPFSRCHRSWKGRVSEFFCCVLSIFLHIIHWMYSWARLKNSANGRISSLIIAMRESHNLVEVSAICCPEIWGSDGF
jgi:hypothetical protein